jgi:hypothetical protein
MMRQPGLHTAMSTAEIAAIPLDVTLHSSAFSSNAMSCSSARAVGCEQRAYL